MNAKEDYKELHAYDNKVSREIKGLTSKLKEEGLTHEEISQQLQIADKLQQLNRATLIATQIKAIDETPTAPEAINEDNGLTVEEQAAWLKEALDFRKMWTGRRGQNDKTNTNTNKGI